MYCKICTKANGLGKRFQAEIFKILHSVGMLVFKNTNGQLVSTYCLHDYKYNTNSGNIFLIKLRRLTTEELIWYCV